MTDWHVPGNTLIFDHVRMYVPPRWAGRPGSFWLFDEANEFIAEIACPPGSGLAQWIARAISEKIAADNK